MVRTDMKQEDVNLAVAEAVEKMQATMIAGFEMISKKNPYEDAIIEAVLTKGKKISTEDILEDAKNQLDGFIKKEYGALPKTIKVVQPKKQATVSGIFHKKFESILGVVSLKVPLMLVGPAGSGKNHTLEQVAEALGQDFYFTNAITQE